jgi:ABC-type phosphate transport system permease subunit
MGDAIIVAYTIGYQYQYLPKPLFDVLERVAPLTSSVIGLVGGLAGVPSTPLEISASNFVGLLLLITAFTILGLTTFLERRLKQRFIK